LENVWKKYSRKVLKAENGKIEKDKDSMTEKRNQRAPAVPSRRGP
jgi:hypothetical protein